MKEEDVDEILNSARQAPPHCRPEVLQSIAASIRASLAPVRPLPSSRLLTVGLLLVCAAVAAGDAARTGFFGFLKMDSTERWGIFGLLGVLVWAAASSLINAMIPGSRRRISAATLMAWSCLALLGLFAFFFRDYQTHHFFSIGIACLLTGLLHAVPAALFSWLLLRRGFAVKAATAGLATGLLGGLAGLAMLELHCPNFEAAHVLVWHVAVVPISGALGACTGWLLGLRRGGSGTTSR